MKEFSKRDLPGKAAATMENEPPNLIMKMSIPISRNMMKQFFTLLFMGSPIHGSSNQFGSLTDLGKWITFGPVFNWSFGKGEAVFSGGVNIAYWDFNHKIPLSVDLGFERSENSESIVYTEIQAGEVFAGASAGVVYKTQGGFGVQGSVWGDYVIGGTLRFRYLNSPFICPGGFFSIPLPMKKT